jgi:hypothetical protein
MGVYMPLRHTVHLDAGCTQKLTMPQAVVCGVVFKGIKPENLDELEIRVNGMALVWVGSAMDESGEILTAGQALSNINGLRGIAQTGGALSVWFDEGSSEGLNLRGDKYGQLTIRAGKDHKPGSVDVFFMCPFSLSGRF